MNNILSFEDYIREFRLLEQQRFNQVEEHVNEGLMTKWRKFKATVFVDKVLKDEIELGKAFEERIKETMKELSDACEKLKAKSKDESDFVKTIKKIISDINEISFDTLTMIGDQDIDFGGFRRSTIMANVVKLGALLSPVKNILMIKKAYRYFLGLIKQAIRRDLVLLIINFDQFQSTVLQKSMEAQSNARNSYQAGKDMNELENIYKGVISDQLDKKTADAIQKLLKEKKNIFDQERKYDSAFNGYMDAYNNTYRQTAEQIKSLMGEDNQKQLEALKNGISKLGQGNDDLSVYGELLISNAEEKALKSTNMIHNNFLKMSEVFKLSNQKKLIDLIVDAEKQNQKKIDKENDELKDKFNLKNKEERIKFIKDEFEKIKKDYFSDDLSKVSLKEIEKLKEEHVKFKFEDDETDRETNEKISKYNILIGYLSIDDKDSKNELKKCSYDLKMLVPTYEKDDTSYIGYIDILADVVDKTLVRNNNDDEQCFIDLSRTKSYNSIKSIVEVYFAKNEDEDQKKVLKYINDDIIKFIGYETFLEKIHEIVDKGVKLKKVKEYFEKIGELENNDDFKKYRDKRKLFNLIKKNEKRYSDLEKLEKKRKLKDEEKNERNSLKFEIDRDKKKYKNDYGVDVPDKFPVESRFDVDEPDMKVSINADNYRQWSKSFEEMREYIKNGYIKKERS